MTVHHKLKEEPPQSVAHLQTKLDHRFSFASEKGEEEDLLGEVSELSSANGVTGKSPWLEDPLVVVVLGASGDLAKKKTYPSLLELYTHGLLPANCKIWGYARTPKTHSDFRTHLRHHLKGDPQIIDEFLDLCFYHHGRAYGDQEAYGALLQLIVNDFADIGVPNTLYYLAVPPNVFAETVNALEAIKGAVTDGQTKFVIEKPFGRDTASCQELLDSLNRLPEHMQYRLDHYLAKPMVESLTTLRQANPWLESIWSHKHVQSIHIRFKEPFGTQGRGGYFDQFNIIRDVLQNHLLQVLLLVAMELPQDDEEDNTNNDNTSDSFRQAKLAVLQQMPPILLEDALLGQYDGYKDDPTITNKDTTCPTYAALRCFVHSERWKGVPFMLEAGKALDDKVVDVQVKFKNKPPFPSNTLTIQVQPEAKLSIQAHMKPIVMDAKDADAAAVTTTEMSTHYTAPEGAIENAYSRLLLDVLKGHANNFVRADELVSSWEVFTPLLHQIERDYVQPESYVYGSDGPASRADFLNEMVGNKQASL